MTRYTFCLVALFLVSPAFADWMQFRGPGASGVSDEEALPVKWSAKEGIVWRTALPGPGTSSPIEVRRRVFLTCYSGYGITPAKEGMEKLMRHVVCIDRRSGAIVWTNSGIGKNTMTTPLHTKSFVWCNQERHDGFTGTFTGAWGAAKGIVDLF